MCLQYQQPLSFTAKFNRYWCDYHSAGKELENLIMEKLGAGKSFTDVRLGSIGLNSTADVTQFKWLCQKFTQHSYSHSACRAP